MSDENYRNGTFHRRPTRKHFKPTKRSYVSPVDPTADNNGRKVRAGCAPSSKDWLPQESVKTEHTTGRE